MKGLPAALQGLEGRQWRAFFAAYLGWTLDAFDYFLLVMVVRHIAADFHAQISSVTQALFLTLAMRPVGALLFGHAADRYGRRPALMVSIVVFAGAALASAFAPTLGWLLALRALFGIGMGGEWGVGASLAMESVPAASRGILSGILQQGYPVGYFLAALAYSFLFPLLGWRGLFVLGFVPALVVLLIRLGVEESPAWKAGTQKKCGLLSSKMLKDHGPLILYMAVLMAAFNAFSHGTQDLYPSAFLEKQKGFAHEEAGRLVMVASLGALCGGIFFGSLSQRIGRRRAIALACLAALPAIPLWISGQSAWALAAGAFGVQFGVQGAWGVVPAHLNELSPPEFRGLLPGFCYQTGNLLVSGIATVQAILAARQGGDYGLVLGATAGVFALVLAVLALAGPEARDVSFERG
jgi:SHS family lactate transporter-like MFS transporter